MWPNPLRLVIRTEYRSNAFEKLLGEMQNNEIRFPILKQIAMFKSKSTWEKIRKLLITSLIYGISDSMND